MDPAVEAHLGAVHASAREAGEVAADAGVDTLALTHVLPYRDEAAMVEAAAEAFSGEVVVGTDGRTFRC